MADRRLGKYIERWEDGQRAIISEEGRFPFVLIFFQL